MRLARTAAPLPRFVVACAGLAGWSRTSGLRLPKPAGWPSPLQPGEDIRGRRNPRRDSNPRFRTENPASQPLDHGGVRSLQSEVLESNQALLVISEPCRHGHRPPIELRRQGSNLRLAINSRASSPLDHAGMDLLEQGAEGEGVEPSTAEAAPVFETGYRAGCSPSAR